MAPFHHAGLGAVPTIHAHQRRSHELSEEVYGLIYWFIIPFGSIVIVLFTFYVYANIRYWNDNQIHGSSWKPVVLLYKYWAHRLRKFYRRTYTKAMNLAKMVNDKFRGHKHVAVRRRVLIRPREAVQRPFRAHILSFYSVDYESEYDRKGEMIRLAQLQRIESVDPSLTLIPTCETDKSESPFSSEAQTVAVLEQLSEKSEAAQMNGSKEWLSNVPAIHDWDEGVEFEYMFLV